MNKLNTYIDHTVLRPEASWADIEKACQEAVQCHFFGVCIDRKWLKQAAALLKEAGVKAVTVVGFPGGVESTEEKVRQTSEAIRDGADEVDMVLNRTLLKEKKYDWVLKDIQSVVTAAQGKPVKVILETSELSDEEKVSACVLSKAAGASFVKTSTGFSSFGATEKDVALMRRTVGENMGVKASGGIRDQTTALAMVKAGASRLGTSASVAIVGAGTSKEVGY